MLKEIRYCLVVTHISYLSWKGTGYEDIPSVFICATESSMIWLSPLGSVYPQKRWKSFDFDTNHVTTPLNTLALPGVTGPCLAVF